MRVDLDNYITGHWGEDQFINEDDYFIYSVCKDCLMYGKCDIDLAYMNCLVLDSEWMKEAEAERKMFLKMDQDLFMAYLEEQIME